MSCARFPRGILVAFAVLVASMVPEAAFAATVYVSAPGLLNQANTTYILSQDISAPGTALTIGATGITLDLNGHTVTYNTAPASSRVCGVTVTSGLRLNGAKITNGSIVQGAGASSDCTGMSFVNSVLSNTEISDLTIAVRGNSTHAIETSQGDNINIHHITVQSTIAAIANRYHYDGYAFILPWWTNSAIHDNTIVGGHGGIYVGSSTNVSIYNNDISHNSMGGNGFGILLWDPHRIRVYGNSIHTAQGEGILVDNEHQDTEVYANTIDVQMRPVGEGYNTWGIKCRTWNTTKNPYNLRVHDNNIRVTTGAGYLPSASGIGIYSGRPNQNDEYYNNNITVITTSSTTKAEGMKVAGDPASGTGTRVYDNTITSNNVNINCATEDGPGASGVVFSSNTLVKGPSPVNYHTIDIGYYTYPTQNTVFLDTRAEGGASISDVILTGSSGGGPYSYFVQWYLDVTVTDVAGDPIPGAAVVAAGQAGSESIAGVTDSLGRARLALTQYYRYGTTSSSGTSNYTNYTPHTVTVSKDGYEANSLPVSMDATKALAVTLVPGGGGVPGLSLQKTADKAHPAPGETVTYTITYANTGTSVITSLVILDPIPPACTYVPGSTRLNGVVVSPDPYASGQVRVPVGSLAPGASGTVTLQVRVN